MRNVAEGMAWAVATPKRDEGTWYNWCGSFFNRFAGTQAIGDADRMVFQTRDLNGNANSARRGEGHYFLNRNGTVGHLGISLGGQYMICTNAPSQDQWSGYNTVGITTVTAYVEHMKERGNPFNYMGHADNMGGQPLIVEDATDWRNWQEFLRAYGYQGQIDGIPGQYTYTAMRDAIRAGVRFDRLPPMPVTQPPVTQPPVTQPPVVEPPVVEPPVVEPPVVEPPVIEPPVIEPPVVEPPVVEPPVVGKPLTQFNSAELENATAVLTENAAKLMPLNMRKNVYNIVIGIGGVTLGLAATAYALAPAIGGQIGDILITVAVVATAVSTLSGTAATALARANANDPVTVELTINK